MAAPWLATGPPKPCVRVLVRSYLGTVLAANLPNMGYKKAQDEGCSCSPTFQVPSGELLGIFRAFLDLKISSASCPSGPRQAIFIEKTQVFLRFTLWDNGTFGTNTNAFSAILRVSSAHLGGVLELFLSLLGPSCASLGPSWGYFGPACGHSWAILELCGAILSDLLANLGYLEPSCNPV